jgi:hypothetical protein
MTFEEWAEQNNLSEYGKACSRAAWQAAQATERERIMKALNDTLTLRWGVPSEALLLARDAIAKYEGEK